MNAIKTANLREIDFTPEDFNAWNIIKTSPIWKPHFDNTIDEELRLAIVYWAKELKRDLNEEEMKTLYMRTWVGCVKVYKLCL